MVYRQGIILCLIFLFTGLASCCNNGRPAYHNSCYDFIPTKTNWTTAKEVCLSLGGHLVQVDTSGEYRFIYNHLSNQEYQYGDSITYYVGASDRDHEGHWVWNDGTPVGSHYWARGEPNNSHGAQDCMVMDRHYDYDYNDTNCGNRQAFICEFSASSPSLVG